MGKKIKKKLTKEQKQLLIALLIGDGTKTEFLENQNKGLKCETLA